MNEKAAPKKRTVSRTNPLRLLAVRRAAEAAIRHADSLTTLQGVKERGQALLLSADHLQKLEDEQEGLKRQLASITAKLTEGLKNAESERSKLIKLAEGTLKKGDPILLDFKARN